MKMISYVFLTPAQEHVFDGFEKVEVRTALLKPQVVATFKTFQGQELNLTIDANGVIKNAEITK